MVLGAQCALSKCLEFERRVPGEAHRSPVSQGSGRLRRLFRNNNFRPTPALAKASLETGIPGLETESRNAYSRNPRHRESARVTMLDPGFAVFAPRFMATI